MTFYANYFRSQAETAGSAVWCALAEKLRGLSPIHLHCNTDV